MGLLAGVFVLACLAILIWRALGDGDATRRRWAWAAFAVTVYFGAQQLLDFFLNLPAILFMFAIPIAWLDATETRPIVRVPQRASRWLNGGLAVGLVVLVVATAWSALAERSALAMDTAQSAINADDWGTALPKLEDAEQLDPSMPATLLPLGLAQFMAGDSGAALATFTRLSEEEDLPEAWINRAALEAASGDKDAARQSLERGLRLGQQQPELALAAGWIYEQLGDMDASNQWYANALAMEPRMARDDFWTAPARSSRWDAISAAALAQLSPAGQMNLWISAGDATRAAQAAATIEDPSERALLELVIQAWGGDAAARASLAMYTRAHPNDLEAIAWSARVAAHAGDFAQAQAYRDWSDITWGNSATAGAEVGIELPPTTAGRQYTGQDSLAWGIYTYRRPTPGDQVLPLLPHLYLTQ